MNRICVFFTGPEFLTSFSSGIAQHFQGWLQGLKADPPHIIWHLSFQGKILLQGFISSEE